MEKELKISELASIWGTSVPTTWNRIRKERLTTFKKKDENNKEVNFVTIPEEILNRYINNINNVDNNVYYEDMLNVNNVNNNVENLRTQSEQAFNKSDIKDIINTLTTVNNDYNDRLKTLTDELITYKSKTLLLEDAKGREGYYINEINEYKKVNNRYKLYNNLLITVITILLLFITGFITYNVAVNKPTDKESLTVQEAPKVEEVQQPEPQVTKAPAKKVVKKR